MSPNEIAAEIKLYEPNHYTLGYTYISTSGATTNSYFIINGVLVANMSYKPRTDRTSNK